MLGRFMTWYQTWEQELLQVLLDPALAQKTAPGYRRWWAMYYARLSELDRRQLYEVSVRWPARRIVKAALVLVGAMGLLGAGLHLVFPQVPLYPAILLLQVLGVGLAAGVFTMWHSYRLLMRHKYQLMAGVLIMAVGGFIIGMSLAARKDAMPMMERFVQHAPNAHKALLGASVSGLLLLVFVPLAVSAWRNAGYEKLARTLQAEAESERLARQVTETQLRLLHAQIEPHFLFNTLGAVQQLAERDHAKAAAELTANLIAFLRSTAGGMAREMTTLHDEFELARAYLHVMQARLGSRLVVVIDLPPGLAACQVPGMSVLTLVENAIKHGAEPSPDPTRITVSAHREGEQLRVLVIDTGAGLRETSAGGMGLRNLRDRLRLAFGGRAALELFEQESGSVVAEMTMPLDATEGIAA